MQFFVIRFGVLGEGRPDPDEMSFKDKVKYAEENDIIKGSKKEDDVMTRAELAYAVYGLSDPEKAEASYKEDYGKEFKDAKDLPGRMEDAVYWSVSEKIMYPSSKGKFSPDKEVMGQELVMTLDRMMRHEQFVLSDPSEGQNGAGEEEPAKVTDGKNAVDCAQDEIKKFNKAGLLAGAAPKLEPAKGITYDKAADILVRTAVAMDSDKTRNGEEYKPIPELSGLEKKFKNEIKDKEGEWSLYVKCFDTGEELLVGNKQMVSASLIKLFVAGTYFDEIKKGNLTENAVSKDHLDLMISESSNTSWESLERIMGGGSWQAGMDKVNAFAKANGYDDTKRHLIIDGRSVNYTSAKDVGEVLDLIYNRKYVSKDASEVILGHMLDQVHTNKIPSGLPEGVKVANKTGELGTNEHDSAIVWADNCTYEIVIMSEGVNIRSIGYKEVAQISNVVYKYMTETED